jgi:hypothetical protein
LIVKPIQPSVRITEHIDIHNVLDPTPLQPILHLLIKSYIVNPVHFLPSYTLITHTKFFSTVADSFSPLRKIPEKGLEYPVKLIRAETYPTIILHRHKEKSGLGVSVMTHRQQCKFHFLTSYTLITHTKFFSTPLSTLAYHKHIAKTMHTHKKELARQRARKIKSDKPVKADLSVTYPVLS